MITSYKITKTYLANNCYLNKMFNKDDLSQIRIMNNIIKTFKLAKNMTSQFNTGNSYMILEQNKFVTPLREK